MPEQFIGYDTEGNPILEQGQPAMGPPPEEEQDPIRARLLAMLEDARVRKEAAAKPIEKRKDELTHKWMKSDPNRGKLAKVGTGIFQFLMGAADSQRGGPNYYEKIADRARQEYAAETAATKTEESDLMKQLRLFEQSQDLMKQREADRELKGRLAGDKFDAEMAKIRQKDPLIAQQIENLKAQKLYTEANELYTRTLKGHSTQYNDATSLSNQSPEGMEKFLRTMGVLSDIGKGRGGSSGPTVTTRSPAWSVKTMMNGDQKWVQAPGGSTSVVQRGGQPGKDTNSVIDDFLRRTGGGQPSETAIPPTEAPTAPPAKPASAYVNPTGAKTKPSPSARSVVSKSFAESYGDNIPEYQNRMASPGLVTEFKKTRDAAIATNNMMQSMTSLMLDVDANGDNGLRRFGTGTRAKLNTWISKANEGRPGALLVTESEIFKLANQLRHDITGAGAGYKELEYLQSLFPKLGQSSSLMPVAAQDNLGLTVALQFAAAKAMWNMKQKDIDKASFVSANGAIAQQIDKVNNLYKKYDQQMSARGQTAKAREQIRKDFEQNLRFELDTERIFNDLYRAETGEEPSDSKSRPVSRSTAAAAPAQTPTPKKAPIRIPVN